MSIHLVLSGVTVIVLGILIPSLFISAFSTIGFSLIIGLLILTAAYVFFSINMVKSKGKKTIKWLMIPAILVILIIAGFYGNHIYQQSLNDKIYSVDDKINLPDFDIEVDKASFSAARIEVPQDKVSRYGGLDITEDCTKYPVNNNQPADYLDSTGHWVFFDESDWEKDHPSAKYCEWRNGSRRKINDYISKNDRLTLNYRITAETNVDSSKIDITLMPDSGRFLKEIDTIFDYDSLLSNKYVPAFDYTYKPYGKSNLGNSINKGIIRKGEIRADIRKDETTVDFKVVYHKDGDDITRIVRISR